MCDKALKYHQHLFNKLKITNVNTSVAFTYLCYAGSQVLSIVLNIIISKLSGIETYGQVVALFSVSAIISNLVSFRSNDAVIVFFQKGSDQNNEANKQLTIFLGLILDLISGLIALSVFVFFSDRIAEFFLKSKESAEAVSHYAYILFIQIITATPVAYLTLKERFVSIGIISIGCNVLKIAIYLLLYYFKKQVAINDVVFSILISTSIFYGGLFLYVFYRNAFQNKDLKINFARPQIHQFLSLSWKNFLSTTIKSGTQNVDSLLVSYLLGNRAAGIYGLTKQYASGITFLSYPFSIVYYTKIVTAVTEGDKKKLENLVLPVNRRLMFAFIVVSIGAMIFFNNFSNLNHEVGFVQKNILLILVLVSAMLTAQCWWCRSFSNAVNAEYSVNASWIGLGVFSLTAYPFIKYFGLNGAALSASLNSGLVFIYFKAKWENYQKHQ